MVERPDTAKRPNVPNYVTESSYTEDIPARTFVGDAQDQRQLSVMNLETGKVVAADLETGSADSPTRRSADSTAQGHRGAKDAKPRSARCAGACRSCPPMARSRSRRCARTDNKDRWLLAVDPESGQARVLDALHDDAWVRDVGG